MFNIHWSTIIVSIFALIMTAVAFFAEIFQAPPVPQDLTQLVQNPIPLDKLSEIKSMSFSNKMGSYKFENTHPSFDIEGPWQMIEPTIIKARKDFFIKVQRALKEIQVRHTHRSDTINIQSFSLDKPLFVISFENTEGLITQISFGLINPIDNSTYFTLSGDNLIYQSNTLSIPLESVTTDELLDAKALAINSDIISMIELQEAPFQKSQLKLIRVSDTWQDDEGIKFDKRKVDKLVSDLQEIKSYMVLDKISSTTQSELDRLMAAPQWKLRLAQRDYIETFFVAGPLSSVGEVKLDKANSLLFYREGSSTPIVLSPEQIQIFKRLEKQMR
jgi:hypothetical protein